MAPSVARAQTVNVTAGGTETINAATTVDDVNFAGNGTINGTGSLVGAATSITIDVTGAANTGTIGIPIADSASGLTDTVVQINGAGGAGIVRLNSANTYVGGTTIGAGGVAVGNINALGTGAVTAADGTSIELILPPNQLIANDIAITGNVTFNDSTTGSTLTGDISGTGTFTKAGNQGITLQGNNTFSGGVNVQAGFVSLDSATAAGTGDVSLADGTSAGLGSVTLGNNFVLTGNTNIFQSGGNATLNGVISGTGSWDKGGDGVINLTNNHTFTGSLDLLAGTINMNGTSSVATDTIVIDGILLTLQTDGGALISTPSVSVISDGTNLNATFRITGDETIGAFSARDDRAAGTGIAIADIDGVGTTLTFGDATDTMFDGLISGTGNLVKQGSGTFSLVSAATYSGSTAINGGVFDLSGAGALASTAITVTGGELQTDGGGLAAAAAVSIGAGGVFDVNGDETINQITNAGTVDVAAGQTLTAPAFTQNSGFFNVNGTFAGATTTVNAGLVDLIGNGALTSDTVTVNGGELQTDGGGLATTANVSVGNGAVFDVNGSETVERVTNAGTVDVAVGQTLTADTFTQNSGLFTVNGAFTGMAMINAGTLGGAGTLNGTVVIGNGAAFAPGNSIGTTNVNGNVTFNAGSTYQVEVNPDGTSDLIQVTGTATINGGTVSVLPEPGEYADLTTFTILTAGGGVSGAFDQTLIDQAFAFLTPTVRIGTNTVFLDLERNTVSFASIAQTPNQIQTATALDASQGTATGELQTIIDEITVQSEEEARNSLEDLDGEIHVSGASANLLALQNVVGTIFDQNEKSGLEAGTNGALHFGSRSHDTGAAAFAAVDGNGADVGTRKAAALLATQAALENRKAQPSLADVAADANDRIGRTFDADIVPTPVDDKRYAGWLRGFGSVGDIDDDGNGSRIDHWSAGVLAGAEIKVTEGLIIGATLGYLSTHAEISNQEFDTDGIIGAVTARYEHASGLGFSVLGGAAHQNLETERRLTVGGFSALAEGDYDATSAFVSGEIYGKARFANGIFKPFVGLDAIFSETDGFTETGAGTAGLTNSGENHSSIIGRVGVAVSTEYTTNGGTTFVPSVSLAYAHEFADTTTDATFSFVGGSANFTTAAAERGRDRFEAKAGLAAQLTGNVTVITTVGGIFSDNESSGTASAMVRIAF